MTDNLLQKLEEKMMMLLVEIENSRKEIYRLNSENASLKMEIDRYNADNQKNAEKINSILSLVVEAVGSNDIAANDSSVAANVSNLIPVKPAYIHEKSIAEK